LAPLLLLLEARDCARAARRDEWELAVEIGALRAAGLTPNHLRWLLLQGHVAQAVEQTSPAEEHRTFRPVANLSLAEGACFVLTQGGAAYVRAAQEAEGRGADGGPAERPVWDRRRRELRVGRAVVKRFRQPWMLTEENAYVLTHEFFFATDFGKKPSAVPDTVREYVGLWLPAWLRYYVGRENWDLVAELLMTVEFLRLPGVSEEWISALLRAQQPDGFVNSAEGSFKRLLRPGQTEERRRFLKNYHSTLVAILAIASYARNRGLFRPDAGPTSCGSRPATP
jgi:hypothetical protein